MSDKVTVLIDEALWNIDDPRIDALYEGRMTLAEFVRSYRAADPWQISFRGSAWEVKLLTEKAVEQYNAELERRTEMLGGEYAYRSRKQLLSMRSSLRTGVPNVIVESPGGLSLPGKKESGCKGCGRTASALTVSDKMSSTVPPRPSPKQSCFECVEKCLGVVMALMTGEFEAGRSRLKIVGNLRLAEEYSTKWQELNAAIHAALSMYQMKGDVPDWDKLECLMEKVRKDGVGNELSPKKQE